MNRTTITTCCFLWAALTTASLGGPSGACCSVTGECTDGSSEDACLALDGIYRGDSTTCDAVTCATLPLSLELVASGLTSPITAVHANDGSGRLFVVDQVGLVRIIDAGGNLLPTPFLDVTSLMVTLNENFDERGLLGLAFHPDYANNGRFFIRFSAPRLVAPDPAEPCFGTSRGCHREVLAEGAVSVGDPNVADPLSIVELFSVDEPQFNHNAGTVAFGPDGFLYFSLGDGGGANDSLDDPALPHGPLGNGQDITTALGSMLRIDVDSPPDPGLPYAIPPSNPFVGVTGLDEIYAYGFRNPFKFSFDDGPGGSGDLYVADVGQNIFEEVSIVSLGGNYGWAIREGANCFDPFNPDVVPETCDTTGPSGEPLIDPVMDYTQELGGVSVIGGFVYRGTDCPILEGRYLFGDFSRDFGPTGSLYYFETTGPDAFIRRQMLLSPGQLPLGKILFGFGEDEDGELYVLTSDTFAPTGTSGQVYKIVPPTPAAVGSGSRYLAINPPPSPEPYALAVAPACDPGLLQFLGAPDESPNNVSLLVDDPLSAAILTSAEWGETVNVTGLAITGSTDFQVHVDCGGTALSAGAPATTFCFGDSTSPAGTGPDNDVDINDILAEVDGFLGLDSALPLPAIDLRSFDGCAPDQDIDINDILAAVDSFLGSPVDGCPGPCSGDCPAP